MSQIHSKSKFVRHKSVSTCRRGDNAILFHADKGKEKVINSSAFWIWQKLDGGSNIQEIAKDMSRQFEVVSAETVTEDIRKFLSELKQEGYIESWDKEESILDPEEYVDISERPGEFDISLTGKCNLHCEYCFYANEMHGRPDLPAEGWFTFFDELGRLGVRNLTLSGGEVFVRKDLWEIIDYLIEKRMRYSILSNGTLITDETIKQFKKGKRRNRLSSIQVSIDGSCPDVHDKSRGKGSFERAISGLRLLKEARFPVTSRVTINCHNVDDLDNIARLLLEDVGLSSFSTNDAMPMGAGCDNQIGITLSPQQQLQAIIKMHELDQKYPGRTNASAGPLAKWKMYGEMEHARVTGEKVTRWQMGYLTACGCFFNKLAVHHDGIISPCNMLAGLELGRINRDSIATIWKTHPILQAMKDRRVIPMLEVPGCEDCEWAPYCNGSCPGLAHTMTGDFNRANPHDCYRDFLKVTGLTSETIPWGKN